MKVKKYLVTALSIAVLAGIALFFINKPKKNEEPVPTKRKVQQINKLDIKDRPYVTLTPRADGREVTLMIDNLNGATDAEYELEYQAESLIQGVFGTLDFSKETTPISKKLLFGSCSKGKCRYDEGVTGGNLVITFEGDGEPYALKTDFNLQLMGNKEGVFSSKDVKATLDVGTSLPNTTYVLVAQTMGLPAEVEGEVLAGPYAFLAATSPTLSGATITIRSKDDLAEATLMQWTGKTWDTLTSEVSEGKISAPVTSLGSYVLVK